MREFLGDFQWLLKGFQWISVDFSGFHGLRTRWWRWRRIQRRPAAALGAIGAAGALAAVGGRSLRGSASTRL